MISLAIVAAVVTVALGILVLSRRFRVRVQVNTHVSFRDLREISREVSDRVGEHLKANFSGDPAQLPGVMRTLLPMAREIATANHKPLDDDTLRTVLSLSVAGHGAASRAEAEAAFDEAMRTGRVAA